VTIFETSVTSVYLLLLITLMSNCMFFGNVDVLSQSFLRGQFESGIETVGQEINNEGANYIRLSKT
jgi:hypothetical protein